MSEPIFIKVRESNSRVITSSTDLASIEAAKILADYLCLQGDCFISRSCEVNVFVTYNGAYPSAYVSQGFTYLKFEPSEETEDLHFISATSASFALTCLLVHLYSRRKFQKTSNPSFHICYPSEIKMSALEVLKGGSVEEFIEYIDYIETTL